MNNITKFIGNLKYIQNKQLSTLKYMREYYHYNEYEKELIKYDNQKYCYCAKIIKNYSEKNTVEQTHIYCKNHKNGSIKTENTDITIFKNCKNITGITISNKIKFIEKNAFNGCDNLKNVIIYPSTLYKKDSFPSHCNIYITTDLQKYFKGY